MLGANGAGKTTVLRAVSNLLQAVRGQARADVARFDGADILDLGPGALVRRGLVPVLEGRRVFGPLTVEENLIAGSIGAGKSRVQTARNLERVYTLFPKLRERRRTPAGLTSGGEQQMLAIGRALMAEPRLLTLDEPSMGLAPLILQRHLPDPEAAQSGGGARHTRRRTELGGGARLRAPRGGARKRRVDARGGRSDAALA